MEIAAFDLGSNTLRVVVMDCESKTYINDYEKMVKTADGLVQTGMISDAAVTRVVEAIREADAQCDFSNKKCVAVTTAAVRMANNRDAVLSRIKAETGIAFTLIDAQKEAQLTAIAVTHRLEQLGYEPQPYLLLDVGGGSTELVHVRGKQIDSLSLDVGIVTMSQKYQDRDDLIAAMYDMFEPFREFIHSLHPDHTPHRLIATAGTPTTMASMKHGLTTLSYDPNIINGTRIDMHDLDNGLDRLLEMNEADRALHVGVGRDMLIIAGVEILKVLFDILGFDEAVVIDDSLREGLAIESCQVS